MFNNLFNDIDEKSISGLTPELKALYVSKYYKKNKKNVILITNTLYEANNFYQNICNFEDNVLLFPMDDFLTSEALAISPELKTTRLDTIFNSIDNSPKIIVTNLMGYLRFLPSKTIFLDNIITISKNDELSKKDLIEKLYKIGYSRSVIINGTGEISTRGFVIDIFPINYPDPIRIEFWGDTIESIKIFNIDTQRTTKNIEKIIIKPNTEFLIEKDIDTFGLKQSELNKYTIPLNISTIEKSICFFNNYEQIENSYKNLCEEIFNYNISNNMPSDHVYMNDFYKITNFEENYFNDFDNKIKKENKSIYDSKELEPFIGSIDLINKRLNKYLEKNKVIICAKDRFKINKIIEMLNNKKFIFTNENDIYENRINLIIKKINTSFIIKDYIIISENDLFNKKKEVKYNNKFKLGTKIRDINKLNIGDFIVHSGHGIGIYKGIKTLLKNNLKKDYIMVEYRDNDKLYIPVEKIEFINKYSSKEGVQPKLNKLGSLEWEKTKIKAKKRIENIAGELLKLYAIRESTKGFPYPEDGKEQIEFEKEFSFNETPDQLKVIEEIKKDMEKSTPMDRLLCGDVGYGKTEVAFRAIFKAILGGKQVAILCPTTILSNQHYNNAIERFKSFPINIEILNRFVSPQKTNIVIEKIKEGKIDLLIGTHRILSDDISFKDLGLLVIDEEQRFGVKHKEKIKHYKNNVDVLTLSATPIPRTLQMSMVGIRNLSLIETPPMNRHPVQTYVLSENKQIIKDAIYKEISREGQCFILFNNVSELESKRIEIEHLVPDAKIICAHGRMTKNELENIMEDFTNRIYNVLLCTTIIETGIDIPNTNTLIIYDADRFGLSQLYQLRGRVGRSNKIAYCYLMYNKSKVLSEIAIKRLQAIKEFTELGSGFSIAMRDLSIRGAGDILGSEQAGFVDTIGIEMFMQMLEEEIKRLKGIPVEERKDYNPLIEVETSISNSFVTDEELKIEIHKKINSINSDNSLNNIKEELEDRFGTLNENIVIYMHEELFEKMANELKINKVKQMKNFIEITIPNEIVEKINMQTLFIEVSKLSRMFRFSMRLKQLIITLDTVKIEKHFIYYLIDLLKVIKKNI